MLRFGLTGSIASGKSTVLDMMAAMGVPTFSADDAVHDLYEGEAAEAVEALFPGVSPGGKVDRGLLAERIVGYPDRMAALESVVHPLVRKRMAAFLADAESRGAPLAVVDIPLLYETGFDYGLDGVIAVTVDPAEQRKRALARPGMTVEKLDAILARQLPQAEKARRANHVIHTNRTIEETRRAVADLVAALTQQESQ